MELSTEGPGRTLPSSGATAPTSAADPPPAAAETPPFDVVTLIQMTVASVGIVANLTVILAFGTHRKLRGKIPNIFIINQSCLDFLCSLSLLLLSLTVRDASQLSSDGVLGDLQCKLWNSRLFLFGPMISSTYNLVCFTVERYLELIHPIWHKTHFSMRKLYAALAFAWCFGIGYITAYDIPTSVVIDGKCHLSYTSESISKLLGVVVVTVQYFVPLVIIIICYARIIYMLSRKLDLDSNNLNEGLSQIEQRQRNIFMLAKRNTLKTLIIVAVCFLACWTQNQVQYFMYLIGFMVDWNSTYFKFGWTIIFVNCTINPFVYLTLYKDFHTALGALFGCKKSEGDTSFDSKSQATSMSTVFPPASTPGTAAT